MCGLGCDLLTFFFWSSFLFFWLGERFMVLTYKVLKFAHWARHILFPPVSLQKQLGHQVELLPGHPCVWFRGKPTPFPSWCKYKLCYSNLWLVTSFMLPTCFLHSPPRFPTYSSKHVCAVSLLSDHTADCGSMSLTGQDCLSLLATC